MEGPSIYEPVGVWPQQTSFSSMSTIAISPSVLPPVIRGTCQCGVLATCHDDVTYIVHSFLQDDVLSKAEVSGGGVLCVDMVEVCYVWTWWRCVMCGHDGGVLCVDMVEVCYVWT